MLLSTFKKIDHKTLWITALVAGVAFYVIKKGSIAAAVQAVTAGAVGAAADVAGGVVSGTVIGAGNVLGVPVTDLTRCKACIQGGDNLGASKYCTAGQFARWQYLSLKKRALGIDFTMSDIFN